MIPQYDISAEFCVFIFSLSFLSKKLSQFDPLLRETKNERETTHFLKEKDKINQKLGEYMLLFFF